MTNREKARRRRQKALNRQFAYIMIVNAIIVVIVMLVTVVKSAEVSENNKIEDESKSAVYESEMKDHNMESSSANASTAITTKPEPKPETEHVPESSTENEVVKFSRNFSDEEKYLLAKMAMAEAEGESIETKVYVILTILNRVYSEKAYFADTIEDVIFQNSNGVYQFSPVAPGGRWWRVEPNEECWEAVEIVNGMEEDISMGALYFESCTGESWHSRNLEFLFKSDNMRFYK